MDHKEQTTQIPTPVIESIFIDDDQKIENLAAKISEEITDAQLNELTDSDKVTRDQINDMIVEVMQAWLAKGPSMADYHKTLGY